MYEVKLDPKPSFVYQSGTGKLYGCINCKVILNYFQYVPAPLPDDININNTNVNVELYVRGEETNTTTLRDGTFFVLLSTLAKNLTEAMLRDTIGDTVYNIIVNTNYDGTPQKTGSGTITNTSEVEIE